MKRYDHYGSYDGGGPADAEESPDGEFVRYEDASAEIERLKVGLAALKQINDWCCFATEEDTAARLMALQQIGVHARAAIAKSVGAA